MRDGVMRITNGKDVDVVIDGVSGKLTKDSVGSLAQGGLLAVVGYAGGREAEVDVTDIIWKAATIRGFTMRLFTPEKLGAAQVKLREYLAEKKLQPTVAKTFPLDQAPDAVQYLIEARPFGRIDLPHLSGASAKGQCCAKGHRVWQLSRNLNRQWRI